MRALVIAHEPDGPATRIEERLVQRGFDVVTHVMTQVDDSNVAAPLPDLTDFDIVIPMGSIRSLTQKAEIESWVYDELQTIRDLHEEGKPILGICFGGQLIAEALGGSVQLAPATEIGWTVLMDGPDGVNPVGPGPWMQWHHDNMTPPPDALVLAENETSVQLIRIGKTVGTQFHPEIDVAHVAQWRRFAGDDYLAKYDVDPAEFLANVRQHEAANIAQCHDLVDWFLDEVAFP